MYRRDAPIIVQSDGSILLETAAPGAGEARDALARFAELHKSPEHVHTYRLTPLSLWNAAGAGLGEDDIVGALAAHSKYDLPQNVVAEVREAIRRFGRLVLDRAGDGLVLRATDDDAAARVEALRRLEGLVGERRGRDFNVEPRARGLVKQALCHVGWPVDDRAGFVEGASLPLGLRDVTRAGRPLRVRDYQRDAARAFLAGGHGVVVLPCGAGKTVVALAAMAELCTSTLILCTSTSAVHQWLRELRDKTDLPDESVGAYTAARKDVRPVTVTTYSMLVRRVGDAFPHFDIFDRGNWGLIVYDEVHLLPAPIFRITADLQARRRLGLTATLVREDGKESDVYSLIGPKRYDVPWREMESGGWIARATCVEVRLDLPPAWRLAMAAAEEPSQAYRLAAENTRKLTVARHLVESHPNDRVLCVGQYRRQVRALSEALGAPCVTGETADVERERLYGAFRAGELRVLVASKVANYSLDLPDASVLVQISGAFGSRQEEAQRLGRILRPKDRQAIFYTLVTRDSPEQRFAWNRQLFLAEQGYRYEIEDWAWTGGEDAPPPLTEAGEPAEAGAGA